MNGYVCTSFVSHSTIDAGAGQFFVAGAGGERGGGPVLCTEGCLAASPGCIQWRVVAPLPQLGQYIAKYLLGGQDGPQLRTTLSK